MSILNVYSRIVDQPVFTPESHPQIIDELEAIHSLVDEGDHQLRIRPLLEACSALPPHNAVCLLDSLRAQDEETFKSAYLELGDDETRSLDGLLKSFLLVENILHTLSPEAIALVKQHTTNKQAVATTTSHEFPGLHDV